MFLFERLIYGLDHRKVVNRDRLKMTRPVKYFQVNSMKFYCVQTFSIGGNVMVKGKQRFLFVQTICPLDGGCTFAI